MRAIGIGLTITLAPFLVVESQSPRGPVRENAERITRTIPLKGVGGIRDASALEPGVRLSDGSLVLSRSELASFDIFDPAGRWTGRIPGSRDKVIALWRSPLALLRGDTVAVFDRRQRAIAFYAPSDGGFVTLAAIRRVAHQYQDACSLPKHLILFRQDSGGIVDAYDLHTKSIRSRVAKVDSTRPKVEETLSSSRVACDKNTNTFFVSNTLSGRTRAYNLSGTQLWDIQPAGLRTTRVRTDGGKSLRLEPHAGAFVSLGRALITEAGLVLQFVERSEVQPSWGEIGRVLSVGINPTNGKETGRTWRAPFIITMDQKAIVNFTLKNGLVSSSFEWNEEFANAR